MSKDDGGPVAPIYAGTQVCGNGTHVAQHSSTGMSLRDYFAGQAMCGLLADTNMGIGEKAAEMAYEQADAMLKARQQ